MPPKRASQPSSIPPSAVSSSIKPSSAASSQSSTQSPLKSSTTPAPAAGSSSTTSPSTTSTKPSSATTSTSSTTPAKKPTSRTGAASSGGAITSLSDAQKVVAGIWERYVKETPHRMKIVDSFMAFLVVLGGVQFVYCVVAGNYPFNAFLSGFSATVGQFVLTASLRMQTNPANKAEFPAGFSDERAFADYVFGSLILHFFCVNFIN